MGTSRSLVESRRAEIVETLSGRGNTKVTELAEEFGVSTLTIRRDLDFLVEQGLVRRLHGSVELIDIRFVEDGDTVFINTSSTALSVIEHITSQNVTVVTNNGKALQLTPPPGVSVILTGGEIRQPKWSMSGEFALSTVKHINAAKAILGCSGFSADRGITTLVSHATSITSLMLETKSEIEKIREQFQNIE